MSLLDQYRELKRLVEVFIYRKWEENELESIKATIKAQVEVVNKTEDNKRTVRGGMNRWK